MKPFPVLAALALLAAPAAAAAAPSSGAPAAGARLLDHGGGCRKSSPAGQCCHMETRTGRVHCH